MSLEEMLNDGKLAEITAQAKALKIPWTTIRPALGKVDPENHFRTQPSAFGWDGSYLGTDLQRHQAKNGRYKVTLHFLPAGEDGKEADDWYSWTSPAITIDWATDNYLDSSAFRVVRPKAGAEQLLDDDVFTSHVVDAAEAQWIVDLGAIHTISRVAITPEMVLTKPVAKYYKAEYSRDGKTWELMEEKAYYDFFSQDQSYHEAPGEYGHNSVEGVRYVRVTARNTNEGADQVAISEIRVRGTKTADLPADAEDPFTKDESDATASPTVPNQGSDASEAPGSNGAGTEPAQKARKTAKSRAKGLVNTGSQAAYLLGISALALTLGGLAVRRRRSVE